MREDLTSGWDSPYARRTLDHGHALDLGPLSELGHPLIAKALDAFGPDGDQDSPEGLIRSATQFALWEVKTLQWRGGVWRDDDGVCWLVAAGLAKGDHGDHDDFYEVSTGSTPRERQTVGCPPTRTVSFSSRRRPPVWS